MTTLKPQESLNPPKKTSNQTNLGGKRMEKQEIRKKAHDDENEEQEHEQAPPLMALNHVSRLCRSVKESIDFYVKVLGFVLIERPPVLDFDGAWLFNYGIGIHLVETQDELKLPATHDLDPMDNHISFQCTNMEALEESLKKFNVKYMKRTMEDDETRTAIDQLFFNDPDGHMIEICNCENLKLVPAGSLGKIKLPSDRHNPPIELNNDGTANGDRN